MTTKIGFIGLGAMGLPMSSNLQRKGFALTVFDLDEAKMDQVVALGARKAATIADASRGQDIVITVLPATPHVEAVVLGSDGARGSAGFLSIPCIGSGTRRVCGKAPGEPRAAPP